MNPVALSQPRSAGLARLRGLLFASLCAVALAGCNSTGGPGPNAKAMKPLSPETLALIEKSDMEKDSPIVVRIFKEESELEVWKQKRDGDYALLKTYPICRWSGELGPKIKEGDRQAPEGFYTITPGQMNPNSNYYLAFNMGFPNAYDRAWGRTGAHLMVHGDCSSSGCYAMTDEQIQEIFALGRDSFMGGQRSFQVQAYPFRMTAQNMARHRNNPNMPFWRMIKEGSDAFEIAKAPPKVDVCERRYVFNATPVDPSQRFDPSGPCPSYTQPEDLKQQVAARRAADEARIASLAPSTPVAPVRTGADGGMNKVFLARLQNPSARTPGSLPPVVKPPGVDYGVDTNVANDISMPSPEDSVALASANVPTPMPRPADAPVGAPQPAPVVAAANGAPAAAPPTRVAAFDNGSGGGSFLGGVGRLFGGGETASESGSGGFSLGKLFGREEPASAPMTIAPAAMAPSPSPVPPQRPVATTSGASLPQ